MANPKVRQFVTDRALGCCEYCMSQEKYASQSFSIEHIFPVVLGGETDFENLSLACQGCNNFKFTKVSALII
jgi:5-methylcytosine-specific restriction endonuclease McrA